MYKPLFLLAACLCAFTACRPETEPMPYGLPEATTVDMIARGKYLVDIMDCAACHSPKVMTAHGPVPDTTRYMAGHLAEQALPPFDPALVATGDWSLSNGTVTAFAGPWGVSFAANLTPDETGIGNWSLAQFTKAIREGLYKGLDGSRPLMPPMGWEAFRHLTDPDLAAIFHYLRSLRPVRNLVPAYIPPSI
jgi:mono/diheme cytochrome c family protein